jgi:hypothetical protein
MELTTLPDAVMANVLVARTEAEAAVLARGYLGDDRMGPANVHEHNPDAVYAQAMEGPDASPPLPPVVPPANVTADFGEYDIYGYTMHYSAKFAQVARIAHARAFFVALLVTHL